MSSDPHRDQQAQALEDLWLWASERRTHLDTDPVPDGLGQQVLAALRHPPLAREEEIQDQGAGLIHQTIPDVAGTEPRLNSGPRYCPMCDQFMKPRECKACGMKTERVPK